MKKLASLLLLAFLSLNMVAQEKLSEGVITTKQTMSSPNEEMNARLALMGFMTITTYFKGDMTRTEVSSPMTGDVVSVANIDTKEVISFINNPMLGKKYLKTSFKTSEEDLKDITVEKTSETKTFLGYECTKYIATVNKDGVTAQMEIYTTPNLRAFSDQTSNLGDKLDGYPMYIKANINQQGMEIVSIHETTEIKKESVSDDKFDTTPPADYEEMQMPAGN